MSEESGLTSTVPKALNLASQIVNIQRLMFKCQKEMQSLKKEIKNVNKQIDEATEWISFLNNSLEEGAGLRLLHEGISGTLLPPAKRLLLLKREKIECCQLRQKLESELEKTTDIFESYVNEQRNLFAQEVALYESQFLENFINSCTM